MSISLPGIVFGTTSSCCCSVRINILPVITNSCCRTRLSALYSDFAPLRTLNPDGYTANVLAWQQALAHSLIHVSSSTTPSLFSLTLNTSLLRDLNTDQWGMPLSLGTVTREALTRREWIEHAEFVNSREPVVGQSRWRIPGIVEVLGWGVKSLGGMVFGAGTESLGNGRRVIVVENLEIAAREVKSRIEDKTSRTDRIVTKKEFREQFQDCADSSKRLSEEDVDLLLKFLERDKGLLVTDGVTVKFKTPGEKDIAGVITTEDATIASLKSLIKDLTAQITLLETRVTECSLSAKESISKGHKTSALATLKSKKMTEATLAKRYATLNQLQDVFSSIEQASDQVELVKIMEDSGKVLAGLNKEVGGVDRVDDVVDALREQMSTVSEVGDIINEVGKESVDDMEVDEELEELERAENAKIEAEKRRQIEEREMSEAEETRRRLDELAELERKAKADAPKEAETEKVLEKSTEGLKRMSLEPNADGTVAQ